MNKKTVYVIVGIVLIIVIIILVLKFTGVFDKKNTKQTNTMSYQETDNNNNNNNNKNNNNKEKKIEWCKNPSGNPGDIRTGKCSEMDDEYAIGNYTAKCTKSSDGWLYDTSDCKPYVYPGKIDISGKWRYYVNGGNTDWGLVDIKFDMNTNIGNISKPSNITTEEWDKSWNNCDYTSSNFLCYGKIIYAPEKKCYYIMREHLRFTDDTYTTLKSSNTGIILVKQNSESEDVKGVETYENAESEKKDNIPVCFYTKWTPWSYCDSSNKRYRLRKPHNSYVNGIACNDIIESNNFHCIPFDYANKKIDISGEWRFYENGKDLGIVNIDFDMDKNIGNISKPSNVTTHEWNNFYNNCDTNLGSINKCYGKIKYDPNSPGYYIMNEQLRFTDATYRNLRDNKGIVNLIKQTSDSDSTLTSELVQ